MKIFNRPLNEGDLDGSGGGLRSCGFLRAERLVRHRARPCQQGDLFCSVPVYGMVCVRPARTTHVSLFIVTEKRISRSMN